MERLSRLSEAGLRINESLDFIDYAERTVSVAGSPVKLKDIEYRMLSELSVNAGRVLTHDELLDRV